MITNDRKFYLNILENLPEGKLRFWLQIGFSPSDKDTYIFDPRLKKEVHFSLHRDGNIHIRNGQKEDKYRLFKNSWVINPNPTSLKQFIYFRPAAESYPTVENLPSTPQTINHVFTFREAMTMQHTPYQNMVFKILLGAPTATSYKQHHKDVNGDPDIFRHEHWMIGIKPMPLLLRSSHDNGTFIWFFNTTDEIPDSKLFSDTEYFEIGSASLIAKFIISQRSFDVGNVACVYYRL